MAAILENKNKPLECHVKSVHATKLKGLGQGLVLKRCIFVVLAPQFPIHIFQQSAIQFARHFLFSIRGPRRRSFSVSQSS